MGLFQPVRGCPIYKQINYVHTVRILCRLNQIGSHRMPSQAIRAAMLSMATS
jgi:hypothetical protein